MLKTPNIEEVKEAYKAFGLTPPSDQFINDQLNHSKDQASAEDWFAEAISDAAMQQTAETEGMVCQPGTTPVLGSPYTFELPSGMSVDPSKIMPLPPPDPSRVIGANPNLGAPYMHPIYGPIGTIRQNVQPVVTVPVDGKEYQIEINRGPKLNSSSCDHDFKAYQGFTESYRYCTKCDHKVER